MNLTAVMLMHNLLLRGMLLQILHICLILPEYILLPHNSASTPPTNKTIPETDSGV
jgi:hypothetical protein